jgi:hypothetical protein
MSMSKKQSNRRTNRISARQPETVAVASQRENELSPLHAVLWRQAIERLGPGLSVSLEKWGLHPGRHEHPSRAILVWESMCRAFEEYQSDHPDVTDHFQTIASVLEVLFGVSVGFEPSIVDEIRNRLDDAWSRRWIPLFESPVDYCGDGAGLVLKPTDIYDEGRGWLDPNLCGAIDPRRAIADAEIIVGMHSRSDNQRFPIFGGSVEQMQRGPEASAESRVLYVSLDPHNTTTDELMKTTSIIAEIKAGLAARHPVDLTLRTFSLNPWRAFLKETT